jgi:hypothetical protein
LIGGVKGNDLLNVTGSGSYSKSFTLNQVNSSFATYNPKTGNPEAHNQSLIPMLAYFKDGVNLSSSTGPLRLAFVGPEGLLTTASYWVSSVFEVVLRWPDQVGVGAVTPEKTAVPQNDTCNISVTAENLGGYPETFNVILYANTTIIGPVTSLTLPNGTSQILHFAWNTAGFAYAHYSITAKASIVKYEVNTTNNVCSGGTVTVTILGDVLGNFKVSILDVVAIAGAYGAKLGESGYNATYDLNNDGVINILDLVTCTSHYGETAP